MSGREASGAAPNVVKSADRAFDVIEWVAAAPTPPTFTQILRALNVPKSSLSQLLVNLVHRRYLDLEPKENVYRLGPGLLKLMDRASTTIPVKAVVDPILRRLRDELNETAGFYTRQGDEIALAAVATSRHALVYVMNVGERAPLYAISPGKIALAALGEAEFEAWLSVTELKGFTRNTIIHRAALRREVAEVRKTGFAYADQEFSLGIKGIACAVRNRQRFFGSVNVSVPIARFDDDLDRTARSELMITADQIARALAQCLSVPISKTDGEA
jgi:IclR family transcriptional regulator, acetate operon repressor